MNNFIKFKDLLENAEKYASLEAYTKALDCINQAISLNIPLSRTQIIDAYSLRAQMRIAAGKNLESISDINKVIEIDPNDSLMHLLRGIAIINYAGYEKAILYFDKAIDQDNKYSEPFYFRGVANYHLKNFYDAISDLVTG